MPVYSLFLQESLKEDIRKEFVAHGDVAVSVSTTLKTTSIMRFPE